MCEDEAAPRNPITTPRPSKLSMKCLKSIEVFIVIQHTAKLSGKMQNEAWDGVVMEMAIGDTMGMGMEMPRWKMEMEDGDGSWG